MDYPIMAITGDFGSGKTLYLTFLGYNYHIVDGLTIFSNYKLYGVDYKHIKFSDVAKMPEWLHDGVLLLDEMHIGTDAYNFLAKKTQSITKFITQLRKRNIVMIMTTQRFGMLAKRVRDLVSYIIEVYPVTYNEIMPVSIEKDYNLKGVSRIKTFKYNHPSKPISDRVIDLRAYWQLYNTDEVISDD